MNKKKFFLIDLIISFVIIIAAVIVSLTAGINLGSDIGGGTQFEIAIEGNVATSDQINAVKDVLKDNNTSYESIFVEDKYVETVIVVRIADKKVENQAEIKSALVEKLEISEEDISGFSTFNGTVTKKAVLYTSITIVCLLLFVFVAGWIRYGVVSGLSLMFGLLHLLMLSVSLFIVTRLPITMTSIIIMLSSEILLVFALVLFLEKLRENSKLKHYENASVTELVDVSKKSVMKPLIFLAVLTLVVAIVLVCVPVRMVTLSACAMIVCLVSSAISFYFITVPLHERLLDLKVHADKLRLSKNSSPAPKKAKVEKTKKETKN